MHRPEAESTTRKDGHSKLEEEKSTGCPDQIGGNFKRILLHNQKT